MNRPVDLVACRRTGRTMSRVLAITVLMGALFAVGREAGFADHAEREHARNAAILDVVAGDYGPARTDLTFDEVGALLPVYGRAEDGLPCYAVTAELIATRDYRGSMNACLGEEDSDAVAVILGREG